MRFLLYILLIILQAETITIVTSTQPPGSSPNGVVTNVTITSPDTSIAGESYSLKCSVSVTGSINAAAQSTLITWFRDDAGTKQINSPTVTTGMVTSSSAGSYSSTLTFNRLATSHAGVYTCRATLDSAEETASKNVTVQSTCSTNSM